MLKKDYLPSAGEFYPLQLLIKMIIEKMLSTRLKAISYQPIGHLNNA